MSALDNVSLTLVESPQDVADFCTWLGNRRPVLGVDIETSGLELLLDHTRLLQFGDAESAWAMSWEDWGGLGKWVFEHYSGQMVAHNRAFEIPRLERLGCAVKRTKMDDTLILHNLLNSSTRQGLKFLAERDIDPGALAAQSAMDDGMARNGWTWGTVPINFEPYWVYGAMDCILTARLWEQYRPPVLNRFEKMYDLELAVSSACIDAEVRGMKIDRSYAEETYDRLLARAEDLKKQGLEQYGVSLGSGQQVGDYLLNEGVPLTKRTASGGICMDAEVLSGLSGKHPVADMVVEYKRSVKFSKAYVAACLERLDENDRVHASLNTLGARTGRMSVGSPPLQQLPSRDTVIRRMFVPDEGRCLLSADLSNIEVRVMAHFAQEPAMMEAFLRGEDVHMQMARAMYGQDAGPKERKKSKSGSLGRQYGIGATKFAVQQGMSVESAREFLRFYDSTFPEIPRFIGAVQDLGASRYRDLGESFVVTPAGRKIQLDDAEARRGEHYKLVAFACQGYAADLLKLAIAGLDAAGVLEASNFIMPVHDELLSEPLVEDAVELGEEYRRIMTSCATLDVPLTADVEIYDKDWSQCV